MSVHKLSLIEFEENYGPTQNIRLAKDEPLSLQYAKINPTQPNVENAAWVGLSWRVFFLSFMYP